MRKFRLNQQGMSLTEVLIAVGLVGVLALAGANISSLFLNAPKYAENSQALINLSETIRQRLLFVNTCNTAIGTSSGQNQGTMDLTAMQAGTQEITMQIPGLQAGTSLSGNTIALGVSIFPRRLKINSLHLEHVRALPNSAYLADLVMQSQSTTGMGFRPMTVATVQFYLTGTAPNMSIGDCIGISFAIEKNSCETMGCKWDPTATPNCQCTTFDLLCAAGQVPTGFSGGRPICNRFNFACNPNQYLIGMDLSSANCGAVAAAAPAKKWYCSYDSQTITSPPPAFQIDDLACYDSSSNTCIHSSDGLNFVIVTNGICAPFVTTPAGGGFLGTLPTNCTAQVWTSPTGWNRSCD